MAMDMVKSMQERIPAIVPAFVGVQARQRVENIVKQQLLRETRHGIEVDMDELGWTFGQCFLEDGGGCSERDRVVDVHKRGQR